VSETKHQSNEGSRV